MHDMTLQKTPAYALLYVIVHIQKYGNEEISKIWTCVKTTPTPRIAVLRICLVD